MGETSRRTVMKALLWKEWRESWWLLLLALIIPFFDYLTLGRKGSYRAEIIPLGLVVATCIVTGLLGARLFAGETANGTAAFRDALPASRQTVWKARLVWYLCFLGSAVVLEALCLCSHMTGHQGRYDMWLPRLVLIIGALLNFSVATLFSVLLDRPITAWLGGFAVSFGILFGVGGGWALLEEHLKIIPDAWRYIGGIFFLAFFLLASAGILYLSRAIYCRRRN